MSNSDSDSAATKAATAVKVTEKQLKLAEKEGAKKGQDLSGLEDMGGVHFFHVVLESSNGNWDLVEAAMKGANTPVDPQGEDRKGGAENIAKAFLSASDERLCIYLHVPEKLVGVINLPDWFSVLVTTSKATVLQAPEGPFGFAKAELLKGDNVFPLKIRDEIIGQGFAYLLSKGVIPDDESDEYEVKEDIEW